MGVDVGTAYVSIIPSGRGFAKALKKEIAKEFANSDLDRLVSAQLDRQAPVVPIELEPLVAEFRREVQRQTEDLARTVTADIDVEVGNGREFRRDVARLVRSVQRQVTVNLDVDVDVDRRGALGGASSVLGGLVGVAGNVASAAGSALSSLAGLAAAAAAVGVAASVAVPTVHLLGGALGALPAVGVSAGAAMGALALGLKGVGDAFGEGGTTDGLAGSAARFVKQVKALKPAFDGIRLHVQQQLFAGMARSVQRLATAWFPQLNTTLGAYAATFNSLAKTAVRTVTQKSFINNIATGAEAGRVALERMGKAVGGPLLTAFGKLSRAAAPFIKAVGEAVAGVIEDFAEWIDQLDESGALDRFFTRAGEVFGDLIEMGKDIGSIFVSVMQILFGVSEDTTASPWESLRDSLDKVAKWLKDPQNQQKVREWITDIKDFAAKALEAANKISGFVNVLSGWGKKIETVKASFTGLKNRISEFLTEAGDKIKAFPGKVAAFLSGLPARVGKIFSSVFSRAGYVIGYGVGVVVKWFAGLPGKIWAFVRKIPSRVSVAVTSAVAWLRGLPQRAANALSTLGSKIGSAIKGIPGRLYTAGRNMVFGLINGVTSLGGWLYDRMASFASSAVQGFKDALGIASPSKVMADQVGRWIPAGIAVGIEANAGDVTDAIDGITPSTVNAPGTPSMAVSGGGLEVGWRAGSTGDPLLDALRQMISIRYRGDAAAALSSR